SEPTFRPGPTVQALPGSLPEEHASTDGGDLSDMELQATPTVGLYDGRTANNGHLQEMPDPVTKTTWGSYALLSPRTFVQADLERGDLVEIKVDGGEGSPTTMQFPAVMQPGMHDDVVAVPLGYGRTETGVVGDGIGQNAYELTRVQDGLHAMSGLSASVTPTGKSEEVAIAQGAQVIDLSQRDIVGTASLEAYEQDPSAGVETHPPDEMLWKDHDYEDTKWGMSIDLTKCTGCSACVTACQEEN
ncbi:MAG: 4Fe-4S binding protein, partial [Bradymonadaceae bacterium]